MDLIAFGDICQGVTVVLSLSAYLPQWAMMMRTQSSRDISLHSWVIWIFSSSLNLTYAGVQYSANSGVHMLLISTVLNFLFIIFTVMLILRYRRPAVQPEAQRLPSEFRSRSFWNRVSKVQSAAETSATPTRRFQPTAKKLPKAQILESAQAVGG